MTGPAPTSRPRRLPATRTGITHKLSIAGFEGYLTANTYALRGSPAGQETRFREDLLRCLQE